MGGVVGWDDRTQMVSLAANGHTVTMWIGKYNLVVDGKDMTMDVAPANINGRTMVPVRFISESFGADVGWDDKARLVTVDTKFGSRIELTIGDTTMRVSNLGGMGGATELITMDTAAVIKNGRTFIPVRYVTEVLGLYVDWNSDTRTVLFTG